MRLLALLVLTLILLLQAGDRARVEFIRPPHFVTEGQYLLIQVRVRPMADHRELAVGVYDQGAPIRESRLSLEGEKARLIHSVEWKHGLPVCEDCTLAATVSGQGRVLGQARSPIAIRPQF